MLCFVLVSLCFSASLACPRHCTNKALGMENGYIKDDQITASSFTKLYFSFKGRRDTPPKYGRLNRDLSWCGKTHHIQDGGHRSHFQSCSPDYYFYS